MAVDAASDAADGVADVSAEAADPWARSPDLVDAGPVDAPEPESPVIPAFAMGIAKAQIRSQGKQILAALRQAERQLDQLKKRLPPKVYAQTVGSIVQGACLAEDAAMAQRVFTRILDAAVRRDMLSACAALGIHLTDQAPDVGAATPEAPPRGP
jgi:hypothetical protein